MNNKEAKEDAEWTLNQIKDYDVTYPVVFDFEGYELKNYRSYGTNKAQRTAFNKAFNDVVKKAGFRTLIYGSKGNINVTYDIASLGEPLWCARYAGGYEQILDDEKYFPIVNGHQTAMWQYTSIGRVAGINGNVDMNYLYVDIEKKEEAEKPKESEEEEVNMPTLKKGSEGKAVKVWQCIVGVNPDGKFGNLTHLATLTFQTKHGLVKDGIVGKNSWRAGLESL